jgi:long-chain acyl-CoA synthetase
MARGDRHGNREAAGRRIRHFQGGVLVNVNPLYTAHEMTHVFAHAEPAAIVAIDMFGASLRQLWNRFPVPNVNLIQAASLFPMPSRRLIGSRKNTSRSRFRLRVSGIRLFRKRLRWVRPALSMLYIRDYMRGLIPSAIACLQYTGCTTGVSKGAMLTRRNLIMNVAQFLSFSGDDMRESDQVF